MTDFKPVLPTRRRAGTGCISQINDHLFKGHYSSMWIDGQKHSRNVYAHTREECAEKLKVLIIEMKTELAELKFRKAEGTFPSQNPEGKKGRKKTKNGKIKATQPLVPSDRYLWPWFRLLASSLFSCPFGFWEFSIFVLAFCENLLFHF